MKIIYAILITMMAAPAWAEDFNFLKLAKSPEVRVEIRRQQAIDLIKTLNHVDDRKITSHPKSVEYEVTDHFLTGKDILVTVTRTVYDMGVAESHCDYKVEILERERTSLHLESCQKGSRPLQNIATKTQFFYDDENPYVSAYLLEAEKSEDAQQETKN